MSEKSKKPSMEELDEKVTKLGASIKKITDRSLTQVTAIAKKRPTETLAMGFTIGVVLGLILGVAIAKR